MKTATSITLTEELIERLDKLAEKEGRTRSNMIERILIEKLDNTETEGK